MESAFKIEIRYLLPVFAGERIYLYRDGNMITGMVQRSGCGSDENKGIKVFEIKSRHTDSGFNGFEIIGKRKL